MKRAGTVLVVLVAIEHLYFLVLEMFLFTKPTGLETFHLTQAAADTCATLAKNQGLYNGFLAGALIASVASKSVALRRFGLISVVVAGVFGTATVGDAALVAVQSLPAVVALVVSELGNRNRTAA
jgi:putative membrane protein